VRLAPSDELLLLARPRSAYAALAERTPPTAPAAWVLVRRPLLALLMIGAFVSISTAGRFTLWHVVLAGFGWSFVPAIQIFWLLILRLRNGRARTAADTIDLFFAGHGAWYALASALMLLITVAPWLADRIHGIEWLFILGIGIIGALIHGVITTATFVRNVWARTRRQTFRITVTYYLAVSATVLGYYLWMGQVMPLLVPHR